MNHNIFRFPKLQEQIPSFLTLIWSGIEQIVLDLCIAQYAWHVDPRQIARHDPLLDRFL